MRVAGIQPATKIPDAETCLGAPVATRKPLADMDANRNTRHNINAPLALPTPIACGRERFPSTARTGAVTGGSRGILCNAKSRGTAVHSDNVVNEDDEIM
eukprot:Opistho-2@84834